MWPRRHRHRSGRCHHWRGRVFGRIFQNFALKLVSVSLGAIIYYIVIQLNADPGFDANLLKLLSVGGGRVPRGAVLEGQVFLPAQRRKEGAKNA